MAQLSKVLKVVCWAGSVPFPPVSLQRQVVCLTVAAGVHVFIRGELVSSYFSMAYYFSMADSYYHEELHSAKHSRRTPRNGEVQAMCQDVRVLERHQRRH